MDNAEVSCNTCVYAHCHTKDYPCCECSPHTLSKWKSMQEPDMKQCQTGRDDNDS